MYGSVPIITKGDFALFLGGQKMLENLEDRPPGRAMILLLIFTIIFQVFMWGLKKYKTQHLQSVSSYAQSLRITLVNNVLNIYGLIFSLVVSILTLVYSWGQASNISITNQLIAPPKPKTTKHNSTQSV